MKIFFDARYIRTDFHDGISRYSTQLGTALNNLKKVTFIIHDEKQLGFLPRKAKFIKIHAPTSAKEPFTALILNKHKPDVVFSPMQTMGSAGRKFKLILTTHDLIYYRHRTPPRGINPAIKAGWYLYHLSYTPQRLALNSADMTATVSSTVMRELQQSKLTKKPIIVVPNAPQDLKELVDSVEVGKPHKLIYMGSFMPYKNVETIIKAMRWLPGRELHLLSKISENRKKKLQALAPKKSKIIFHNGTSDKDYAKLLSKDAVLVTASLDEGYGLPVAEAIGLGVPAVVSDIPIFHEVAAGGALYFDPLDPSSLANKVKELDKKDVRDHVVIAGQEHIKTFSWESSARSLLSAIKSLV